ncbi:hypothetical protein I7X12_08770 [Halosimplex litoreum]|uniref:Uncharacterized protein n=1 Tax=Halosimplex litoreum TaxID=1198301 RepID=A0A7U3WAN5_9EURY|nr:hypothetical protein [Halosimplex litoreum]QPV64680.1 hypothetical protein I7X12_08770 [Halosimplex litoreum]
MVERSGRFRVYRVVESVRHVNLQAVDSAQLYTVYESGYADIQPAVDDLTTGDLVAATLAGDPDADEEPWRLTDVERVGGVAMDFAVGVEPPDVAREAWTPGLTEPVVTVLEEDGEPVGACCVQPRDPLPGGAFVPNVLTGVLPLESTLSAVPGVGGPATEVLVLDPDQPDATSYSLPYGVLVCFTAAADRLVAEFRHRYDCPRHEDTRPEFDPYGV